MEQVLHSPWRPHRGLTVLFGIATAPFVFLYVNRPGYFWLYLLLGCGWSVVYLLFPQWAEFFFAGELKELFLLPYVLACLTHGLLIAWFGDHTRPRGWYARWWLVLLLSFLPYIVLKLVQTYGFGLYQIPASSMSPTLKPGMLVLVKKYHFTSESDPLQHGDLVLFQKNSQMLPGAGQQEFVKRVIGLPGDRVVYQKKQVQVSTNCQPQTDICTMPLNVSRSPVDPSQSKDFITFEEQLGYARYLIQHKSDSSEQTRHYFRQPQQAAGHWRVPDHHYFVLGDNRDNSFDSRFWGFLPESLLTGKVVFIFGSSVPGFVSWPVKK
ncbi:signal peptidase I [Rheinheimera sp. A13L]|uniref:signal peptidase I n=1 Tax=Rheinheimera sp. A13L TaxID=506534 RepID=UPI0002124A63|nr:signal peptidase I [Rheinheimera sp. A13L]EGM77657.1 signal peptidase I [Rheinheimera sp. A13L]